MRKLDPYKSLAGALRALDNGGRFYNIFTSADDRVVSAAELKKVAGVFGNMHAPVLFLELATSELEASDRKQVRDALGPKALAAYRRYRVERIAPAEFAPKAKAGKGYLVEGRPRKVDDVTKTGVIMMPMMIGQMTTLMPIPTAEYFSVYELDGRQSGDGCLVLAPKKTRLARATYRFAGIAKVNEIGEGKRKRERSCLEPMYYCRV